MTRTLQSVAGLTAFLILLLSVLAIVLSRLYQRSNLQSVENRLTTARLETIVATSVDAIVVVNRVGKVLEFNPAAQSIFGFTRAEAMGEQVTDLIFPPDAIESTIAAIETHSSAPRRRNPAASGSSSRPCARTGRAFRWRFRWGGPRTPRARSSWPSSATSPAAAEPSVS